MKTPRVKPRTITVNVARIPSPCATITAPPGQDNRLFVHDAQDMQLLRDYMGWEWGLVHRCRWHESRLARIYLSRPGRHSCKRPPRWSA